MKTKIKLGIGWLVLVFFLALGLAACGSDSATATTVPTTSQIPATATPPTPQQSGLTNGVPTISQVPPTATQSNAQSKVGQELVGQSAKKGNLQASISKVQALTEIKDDFKKQVFKPAKGVFLLVFFDLKNSGTSEETFSLAQINDNNGTALDYAAFEADFALSSSKSIIPFTPNSIVQPGGSGQDFKLFDVPADASGLKFSIP